MAVNVTNNRSMVRIGPDMTQAFITLYPPEEGQVYEESDLRDILEQYGVVEGINREALRNILQNKVYLQEVLVAEGIPAVDGKDGEYTFLFNTKADTKPKILKDGSVDYTSMGKIEVVGEGQEIVYYTPATPGTDGFNVKGEIIKCHPGRDLPQIKGKGFRVSDDKKVYTAAVTGKVDYQNNRLVVSNLLTIDGDVNHVTGDITFNGDILIRGNVSTGMSVNATGNITVDGHVEAASLESGKDIVLKNGMQGGGRGEIHAGGDVSGKFFEQTTIYAKGSVNANAIMNCQVISEQKVIVSGRMGVLVGGSVNAVEEVDATMIGNMSEVKMTISVGTEKSLYSKLKALEDKIRKNALDIEKITMAIKQINAILERKPQAELSEKKMQLLRTKIERDTQTNSLLESKERIEDVIERSALAKVVVSKSIFRGTTLVINGERKHIESENYNVTYCKKNGEIISYPNI